MLTKITYWANISMNDSFRMKVANSTRKLAYHDYFIDLRFLREVC